MAGNQTRFEAFLSEQVGKYKGVSVPVKASLLRRLFVRSAYVGRVHPNPNDEFCDPKVGPNYEIVSHYEHEIWTARCHSQKKFIEEPLTVEKMHPDGYMLLNGHHRWAAAVRMSLARVPIRIVNVTHVMDIEKMLKNAAHSKRVTLDLDEVVFVAGQEGAVEKPLPFPLCRLHPQRLRRGVPALFHFLKTNGYDIWIYTAQYDSMDSLRRLFRWHRAPIDGVVTGLAKKDRVSADERKRIESMVAGKYPLTLHIDLHSIVRVDSRTKQYAETVLTDGEDAWSGEIMEKIGAMEAHEG